MIQSYWGPGLAAHEAYEAESERIWDEAETRLFDDTRNVVITWGHGDGWDIDQSERFLSECKYLFYGMVPKFVFDTQMEYCEVSEIGGVEDKYLADQIMESVERILKDESPGRAERKMCVEHLIYVNMRDER